MAGLGSGQRNGTVGSRSLKSLRRSRSPGRTRKTGPGSDDSYKDIVTWRPLTVVEFTEARRLVSRRPPRLVRSSGCDSRSPGVELTARAWRISVSPPAVQIPRRPAPSLSKRRRERFPSSITYSLPLALPARVGRPIREALGSMRSSDILHHNHATHRLMNATGVGVGTRRIKAKAEG